MNILVTLNPGYIRQLIVMLYSLVKCHEGCEFTVYIIHSSLSERHIEAVNRISPRLKAVPLEVPPQFLSKAPKSSRYPTEMYYRIFAAKLLPRDIDRVLYLDPDLVVINPVNELYYSELDGKLFAAASHLENDSGLSRFNRARLSMPEGASYVNSGVMLMDIGRLRASQREDEVFDFISSHKNTLMLPDQDVLNAVYSGDIAGVDHLKYNLSERCFGLHNIKPKNRNNRLTLDWVRENTSIIHYCGRNKPWKNRYYGKFDCFYHEFEKAADSEGLI